MPAGRAPGSRPAPWTIGAVCCGNPSELPISTYGLVWRVLSLKKKVELARKGRRLTFDMGTSSAFARIETVCGAETVVGSAVAQSLDATRSLHATQEQRGLMHWAEPFWRSSVNAHQFIHESNWRICQEDDAASGGIYTSYGLSGLSIANGRWVANIDRITEPSDRGGRDAASTPSGR